MSDGNYGGNGSICWEITHQPELKQRMRWNPFMQPDPKTKHVFEKVKASVEGHDPVRVWEIGEGTGNFNVTLRFDVDGVARAIAGKQEAEHAIAVVAAAAAGEAAPALKLSEAEIAALAKTRVQEALLQLSAAADEAYKRIRDGKAAKVAVAAGVPAVHREQKPKGDWEVSVNW
jgi:hypothetical protein